MTAEFTYPAIIEDDGEGMYLVTFPDLPEALTDGETKREAFVNAVDALEEAIASRIEDKEEIPTPSKPKLGEVLVQLPVLSAAKAAFYKVMQEKDLNNSQFARATKQSEASVRRLLDPRHGTKIAALVEALNELGVAMHVSFENVEPPRAAVIDAMKGKDTRRKRAH